MSRSICCAYLRVYQPIEVLPSAERARLERLTTSAGALAAPTPHPLGLIAQEERREFYVVEREGERLVCPALTRLRSMLGLVAFERSVPSGAARLFFDPDDLRRAHAELERIQACEGDLHPPLVQSAWQVPIRWFVCFDDAERRLEQDTERLRIRYETTMERARTRVSEALEVLKGGIVHPVIVGMVYELDEWLGTFHERSVVELDYASVSDLFESEELADDRSAKDVWDAIYALARGDGMGAGLHYQRVNERWNRARGRESLN